MADSYIIKSEDLLTPEQFQIGADLIEKGIDPETALRAAKGEIKVTVREVELISIDEFKTWCEENGI